MRKSIILAALVLIPVSLCFLPLRQQKTIAIKSSYYNVYASLHSAGQWGKWRRDLAKISSRDSGKISIKKDTGSFIVSSGGLQLSVSVKGNLFEVEQRADGHASYYSYLLVPRKTPEITSLIVLRKTSLVNFLFDKIKPSILADTHAADLKNFIETDSLNYGYAISKIKVPGSNLIEIKRSVPKSDEFKMAARMHATLRQYITVHNIRQLQPVIAQFLPRGKDSVQVNVGFFVNKEVKSAGEVSAVSMPAGAPLYVATFRGKFNEREKAYSSLKRYFSDHQHQAAILPFETYLDNVLPVSDTSKVHLRVNFGAYF